MAATRAFRLIPVSARARLSTSRWVGVRSSGVLQKERMVRLLRQRPARAGKKGEAGVRAGEAAWAQNQGLGWTEPQQPAPFALGSLVRAARQTFLRRAGSQILQPVRCTPCLFLTQS